ncbi:MAG TPA: peptidylprolyl isomerase [bacterium]|nr:peptidylprolyl isomerase [bacterium]
MKFDFLMALKIKKNKGIEASIGIEAGETSSFIKRVTQSVRSVLSSTLSKRIALAVLLVLALFQLGIGIAIYGFKSSAPIVNSVSRIIPYPVAMANYDFVSHGDFLREQSYVHHFYAATKQEGINYQEVDQQIMEQLVENKLIFQEAARRRIVVKKEEVDTTLDGIVEQNGGKDKVEKVLTDLYGLGLSDFRRLVEQQALREKVNEKLISRVEARHILVRVDKDAPEDKVNEAKSKIDGFLNDIRGGQDFAEVAKKNSEDIGSAEQGGKLEPFAVGEMVKEFSDTAFKTKVGEISDPVRSEFGWHIIKVENKTGQIEQTFADWIAELKDKSVIVRFYAV